MKNVLKALAIFTLTLNGCALNLAVKSFTDPSLNIERISTVAILPFKNGRLAQDEQRDLLRQMTEAFGSTNPNVKIVTVSEAVEKMNKNNLVAKYSEALSNYNTSGMFDATVLNEIKKAVGADAILQGSIIDLTQIDGVYGQVHGTTRLTLQIDMIDLSNGKVLWEATGKASQETPDTVEPAPPLFDVVQEAMPQILVSIPKL